MYNLETRDSTNQRHSRSAEISPVPSLKCSTVRGRKRIREIESRFKKSLYCDSNIHSACIRVISSLLFVCGELLLAVLTGGTDEASVHINRDPKSRVLDFEISLRPPE